MALVSGFLRQSCTWTPRTAEFDTFGQPMGAVPRTIPCRWTLKSGWARGVMGDASTAGSYRHAVMVDAAVNAGDLLMLDSPEPVGGVVKAVETIIDASGREQGRTCYV